MTHSTLYDDDILEWSEQQAEAIRRLGRTAPGLPNELDVENVAEEIESVGRSELAAVKSNIRLIFLHLIKLYIEPRSEAAGHWRGEIIGFHGELLDRYAPSMRQRIEMDCLWRSAREQTSLAYDDARHEAVAELPDVSPTELDELIAARIDVQALVERLRPAEQGNPT